MMLFKYILKTLLKNKTVWFWGLLYVTIWLFLGVFVWGNSIDRNYLKDYAGIWFAFDSIISISSISVTLSYSIYYASSSLAYLFRNSSMKPFKYYMENMFSIGTFFVIMGTILELIEIILFSIRFNMIILPNNIILTVILFFISGMIFYSFSMILVIIMNNYLGLKNVGFVSFIPMIISWLLSYSILYIKLPSYVIYSNFITTLTYIFTYSFIEKTPSIILTDPFSPHINVFICTLSIIAWLILLMPICIYSLSKIRASSIEEARVS
ncbi:MAG: hypothetical protein ACP5GR_04540 [Thermoplasmata archaeon]|jgi:hypothetical protein